MTVLDRAKKEIKEERENVLKKRRKITAEKVTRRMLKDKTSLTERNKTSGMS